MFEDVTPDEIAPLTDDELAALPVFPLPRVVFFPGTALPLHLFEPRYRRMIDDCMTRGPEVMAVTLLADGWERDYAGAPAFHEVAGVGRIVAHDRLADGRHDIVLYGLARARLDEIPAADVPYRRARATVLRDAGRAEAHDVRALLACAGSVVAAVQKEHPEFTLDLDPSVPPSRIADVVADRLVADVATRQAILEALDLTTRFALVTDAVGELMAMLASRGGRDTLH